MYENDEGLKYSKDRFDEYKYRAQVRFLLKGAHYDEITRDIYTTDLNKDNVAKVISERVNGDKGEFLEISHWASREQDDLTGAMIDEWILERENEDKEQPFVEEDY